MLTSDIYYFGCWQEAGHYLRDPRGYTHHYRLEPTFPVAEHVLDGGLLPPGLPEVEGRASLIHVNGWTILTFWDRSVDSRGKCSSTFIAKGTRYFDAMVLCAKYHFPNVWERFKFQVVEYKP